MIVVDTSFPHPDQIVRRRGDAPHRTYRIVRAHGPYGDGTYYYLELEPHPNEFGNEPFAVVSASYEPVADAAFVTS